MITIFGMTNTLLTETNKSKEPPLYTNAIHKLTLGILKQTNLRKRAQHISAFIFQEEHVLKE